MSTLYLNNNFNINSTKMIKLLNFTWLFIYLVVMFLKMYYWPIEEVIMYSIVKLVELRRFHLSLSPSLTQTHPSTSRHPLLETCFITRNKKVPRNRILVFFELEKRLSFCHSLPLWCSVQIWLTFPYIQPVSNLCVS